MSEQEAREVLRTAVDDEPPLNFDPDALIDDVRKRAKRRRAMWSAGTGVVAVAALAVTVPIALGGSDSPDTVPSAAGPAAAQPAPPDPYAWPPPGIEPKNLTEEELRQRGAEMREHLQGRFPAVVPDATKVAVGEFSGEAIGAVSDGQTYLNSFVRYTISGQPTAVNIQVNAPGADMPPPGEDFGEQPSADATQHREPQPDGSVLVREELGGDTDMVVSTVRHYRTDGVVVMVSAYNYDPVAGTGPESFDAVPVTTEQLIELATDPALRL